MVKNRHRCTFEWIVIGEYICRSTMIYYIETWFILLNIRIYKRYKAQNDGCVNVKHKSKGVVDYFHKAYKHIAGLRFSF